MSGRTQLLGTALLHPERYKACVDISGGIGMTLSTETLKEELDGDHFRNNFPLFNSAFGPSDEISGSAFDIETAAKEKLAEGAELCDFHIICGSDEFIRERVEKDRK